MIDTRVRRLLISGIGVLLVIAGSTVTALPAHAVGCASGVPGDVNGDGYGELAVSSAGSSANRGAVHVFYGQSGRIVVDAVGSALDDQYIDQHTPGVPAQATAKNRFGSATAFGDFNNDGCADLAIGAPGDGLSGSVTVMFGSPRGLTTKGAQRFGPDAYLGLTNGSQFGRSLAVADLDGDRVDDLAVGVPRLKVPGKDKAGAVVVLSGSSNGLRMLPVSRGSTPRTVLVCRVRPVRTISSGPRWRPVTSMGTGGPNSPSACPARRGTSAVCR